jgi:hypothetical protein
MKTIRRHDACNWMLSFLRALRSCRGDMRGEPVATTPLAMAPPKLVSG